MAQKQQVVITDDIDGSADAKAYTFAFNGTEYEIDLGPANRDSLIRALQPYIDNARRRNKGASRTSTASDSKAIREWAKANGLSVPDRGRIPSAVQTAYASR